MTIQAPFSEKIAVIGSNSFAGAWFVNHALDEGHEVLGISRSSEPHPIFLPYKENLRNKDHFRFHRLNLNHDFESISSVLGEFRPDYVIDFASQGMVAESWLHPEQWYQTTVVGKVRLHECLRKLKGLKKYVRVSTPEVYGSCAEKTIENRQYDPSTPYAVSHAAIDMSLYTFYKNYGFPVVFTRSANFFGPYQQLYRIIPRSVAYIKLGRKIHLHGGGKSVRSFIHAKDVADATLRVAKFGEAGEIYHLATDEYISIRDLVQLISNKLGIPLDDAVEVTEDRPGKDLAYRLDTMKIQNALGWRPKITLEEGIDETISWITKNLEVVKKLPLEYIHQP